jgi:hypothetical protein
MHRSVPGFFTGPSLAFARAWQSSRVVRRTRSQMTASPWSYDLLLHRLVSDFSTELSPVHQPVLHNLSTGLSTGCKCHGEDRRRRSNPGSSAWAGSTGNGSGALIPASGSRKRRAAYDRWFPDRRFALESSTAHSPPEGHKMPDDAADAGMMAPAMVRGRRSLAGQGDAVLADRFELRLLFVG